MNPNNQEYILATGFSKPINRISLDDRDTLCSVMFDYHCLLKSKSAMDQYLEGLADQGISRALLKQAFALKEMFVFKEKKMSVGEPLNSIIYIIY